MLVFATSAKSDTISSTIGRALTALSPAPPNRFVGIDESMFAVAPDDLVIACGKRGYEFLRDQGILPKGRSVDSLRERVFTKEGRPGAYMLTYDPGVVRSEPGMRAQIAWDVQLAARFFHNRHIRPTLGVYRWVSHFEEFVSQVESRYKITGKPVHVTTDTETMGFFPWYADKDILSISFTNQPGYSDVLYLGPQEHPCPVDLARASEHVDWLLNSPCVKLQAHNGKYDLIWIAEKWGIECSNFVFDSMLGGQLLDENRSNSLNWLAKELTPLGGYDDEFNLAHDKGKMAEYPADDRLLIYAGGDTDAAHRVAENVRRGLLQDEALTRFYVRILHPAARAFERMERRGVVIDPERFAALRLELDKEIHALEQEALAELPPRLRIKHRDTIDKALFEGRDPFPDAVKRDLYFSPLGYDLTPLEHTPKGKPSPENPKGIPSVSKAHLDRFAADETIKATHLRLTKIAQARKTRSTFVDGFLDDVRPDGLLHPTYFLAAAEFEETDDAMSGSTTGRLSAKNPPFQIIPKKTDHAKRIRRCYTAPPGYEVLSIDYSQGELRVVACIANEETMIEAYRKGLDMHAVTGAKLAGIDLTTFLAWGKEEKTENAALFEKYRGNAKPANFGLLYGQMPEGFIEFAFKQYGRIFTLAQGRQMSADFFDLYPGLPKYHERQKMLVKQHGFVRSPLGRIRRLPAINSWDGGVRLRAERQAINAPVQSTLTDMMIWAISILEDKLGDRMQIVGMIHDALIAYIPEGTAQAVFADCYEIMTKLPFDEMGWFPQLPFPVDGEYGPDLASLSKIKL